MNRKKAGNRLTAWEGDQEAEKTGGPLASAAGPPPTTALLPVCSFLYGVAFTWAKMVTSIDIPAPAACENDPP
jgi:hypothetical protein